LKIISLKNLKLEVEKLKSWGTMEKINNWKEKICIMKEEKRTNNKVSQLRKY
jgi:hypothetical protein